jgi:hypothetical protein
MLPALGKTQNFADRFRPSGPTCFFFSQTFLSHPSETVYPGPPIVLGDPPFGGDPARLFHTVKRRVERPFLDTQGVIGDLLNARGDAVPVPWLATERLENKQIECPKSASGFFFRFIPRTLGYGLIEAMSRSPLPPAIPQVVGALRVHPHKHSATILRKKIEDAREAGVNADKRCGVYRELSNDSFSRKLLRRRFAGTATRWCREQARARR